MYSSIIIAFILNLTLVEAKILTPYEVEKMSQQLMDSKKFVGLSVAVVTPSEDFTVHLGETKLGSGVKPTSDSLYEIGSVTKAITGTMAAQMVLEGKIKETDVAQSILKGKKLSKKNESITVLDLLTQRSGIVPIYSESTFKPKDPLNPWAGFNENEMYSVIAKNDLKFVPGSKYEYSNIATALTGYLLEAVDKQPYAEMLKARITQPLQLKDTVIALDSEQNKRLVQGYYNDGKDLTSIAKWDMTGVPAMGSVVSSLQDMVTIAKGLMDTDSQLGKAFDLAARPLRTAAPGMSIGYFWHYDDANKFVWHNGSTYGMSSLVLISKEKKTAVILLTNTMTLQHEETALAFALMTQAVAE